MSNKSIPIIPERSSSSSKQHDHSTPEGSTDNEHNATFPDCPFCTIIHNFPPVDPLADPANTSHAWSPHKLNPPAYVLLSTKHVVAFLDIAPLTRGHVLVSPRRHVTKAGDMTAGAMSEVGRLLPLIARAVTRAVLPDIAHSDVDYNVVQNNGPGAAQVVPHVHFHIVPRPPLNYQRQPPKPRSRARSSSLPSTSSSLLSPLPPSPPAKKYAPATIPTGLKRSYIQFGRGARHELDDDDAAELVEDMRQCVREEWTKEFGTGTHADADIGATPENSLPDTNSRRKISQKL